MRILVCTGIFSPEVGGPATYTRILAEKLTKRGHEVRVITYSNSDVIASEPRGERGNLQGIASSPFRADPRNDNYGVTRILRSRFKPWHYFKYFLAVKKYGKDAGLIYAQDPVSAGYPSHLAARILRKPFVVKITGDYSWEQSMGRGVTDELIDDFQKLTAYPFWIGRMRQIQINVCREASLTIVPSQYLKRLVSGWGVNPDKIKVIYNAVHIPKLTGLTKHANEFLIVSSGRSVPWKGFGVLREVVSTLSNSMELDTRRVRLEILQNMPRAEMLRRLAAADLYVLNTGYEGFAHSVVEAMAVEVPVVTTNVGGNPEVIEDGYNGLLVEYNNAEQIKNAIRKLYQDAELRRKFIQNGKTTVKKFWLEKMISETERTLLSCAS